MIQVMKSQLTRLHLDAVRGPVGVPAVPEPVAGALDPQLLHVVALRMGVIQSISSRVLQNHHHYSLLITINPNTILIGPFTNKVT